MTLGPEHRLAVYGTLAPGRENHGQLADLRGEWTHGTLRGHVHQSGWGGGGGRYPGLRLDPAGGEVAVQVFTSLDLPDHWARLDAFEGADYQRAPVTVLCDGRPLEAQVYVIAV